MAFTASCLSAGKRAIPPDPLAICGKKAYRLEGSVMKQWAPEPVSSHSAAAPPTAPVSSMGWTAQWPAW